jgi:hypothetical protein
MQNDTYGRLLTEVIMARSWPQNIGMLLMNPTPLVEFVVGVPRWRALKNPIPLQVPTKETRGGSDTFPVILEVVTVVSADHDDGIVSRARGILGPESQFWCSSLLYKDIRSSGWGSGGYLAKSLRVGGVRRRKMSPVTVTHTSSSCGCPGS